MVQQKLEYKNQVLVIRPDETPENPRKHFDNLGVMVCRHPRYDLGDIQTEMSFEEYLQDEELDIKDIAVMLPLHLYDHNGISIYCGQRTYPYSDEWDSSIVGVIYVTNKMAKEEWNAKQISEKTCRDITDILEAEVSTYDQYLRGDTYGFILYEKSTCNLNEEHLTETDSCWGFYGYDHTKSGISDHVKDFEKFEEVI